MPQKDIEQTVKNAIQEYMKSSRYSVVNVPFHTHNNIDSPLLPFTGLSDVPGSYENSAGFVVTVNSTETGLQFSTNFGTFKYLIYRCVASTTSDATGTSVGGTWVAPFSGTVTAVGATVDTAGTTGTTQLDINKNASSILSTKITIDSAETSSRTAATPPVISTASFSTGDIFTFDIDTVQTTPAMGLSIFMNLTQTGA